MKNWKLICPKRNSCKENCSHKKEHIFDKHWYCMKKPCDYMKEDCGQIVYCTIADEELDRILDI